MRRAPLTLLSVALLASCSRRATPVDALARDAAPAQALPVTDASLGASSSPPTFARPMRGTIDDRLAIVMRLAPGHAGALEGAYFYVPSASDLHLRGAIAADGSVHLDESSGKTSTGAFDGRVDARGAFDGTWSDAKKTRALHFHLEQVIAAPGGPVAIVDRAIAFEKKATRAIDGATWSGPPSCKADAKWPEIVGAFEPAIEAKVNAKLRDIDPPHAGEGCELPSDRQVSYAVLTNEAGVLSVRIASSSFGYGAAHPLYGALFVNVSVPSGAAIALHDVVTAAGDAVIEREMIARLGDADDDLRGMVRDALHEGSVDVAFVREGLRVSAFNALPHAFKGATEDAAPIPPSVLEGVRVRPSPVDALWAK